VAGFRFWRGFARFPSGGSGVGSAAFSTRPAVCKAALVEIRALKYPIERSHRQGPTTGDRLFGARAVADFCRLWRINEAQRPALRSCAMLQGWLPGQCFL